MPLVSVQNVTKSFGAVPVLKGVSLQVEKGSVVAMIGKSGSGKSTLLRCINGLETHDGGAITVGDLRVDAKRATLRALRRRAGMIFQQFNLFPHLTAAQNIMLAPRLANKVPEKEARALALEMLARVGLAEKADSYPNHLSGGQQQRVAIARALAMRPELLLCDEITSSLDPELVGEVLAVIEQLARDGMTLIIVTHEMPFARKVSEKVVFMHEGRIHEEGSPEAIFTAPRTPELAQFIQR